MIWFFTKKIKFETERLILRPLKISDKKDIAEIINTNTTNYLSEKGKSRAFKDDFFESAENFYEQKTQLVYGIELKSNSKLIGLKAFYFPCHITYNPSNNENYYWYDGIVSSTSFLNQSYWGFGYMSEASSKLLKLLIKEDVRAFYCSIRPQNAASIRYNLNLGYKQVSLDFFNRLNFFTTIKLSENEAEFENTYLFLTPKYFNRDQQEFMFSMPC